MSRYVAVLLCVLGMLSAAAQGQSNVPVPILPDSLRWVSPPSVSGLQMAWVLGTEQKPGAYILRVKLAGGARIPPHTHPDERNTTVLAGVLYVGFGRVFDEAKVVAIPVGAVYVAPADVSHYIWAKDGAVMFQETGVGPTATVFMKR
jgi:quercetin dioxygenase-like cupin family protein